MKWQMFIGHAVVLASLLITVAMLVASNVLRKRQQRRSPLQGKAVGHVPGQQLLDRIDEANEGVGHGISAMILALPMLFLVWATMRIDWTIVRFGVMEMIFLIAWAICLGIGFRQYQRHSRHKEQARDGLIAERVTGMQLNRLVAKGCIVMHDLPCGDFNIDHIVIAPRGVYAVETKSFRKPKALPQGEKATVEFDGEMLKFSDFSTRKPIEQARRQARFLADFLRESLGEAIRVDPAISLPGWWIDKSEAGKASDVFVFTPMRRGCEWFTYGEEIIPASKRSLLAQALATRYTPVAQ